MKFETEQKILTEVIVRQEMFQANLFHWKSGLPVVQVLVSFILLEKIAITDNGFGCETLLDSSSGDDFKAVKTNKK